MIRRRNADPVAIVLLAGTIVIVVGAIVVAAALALLALLRYIVG